MSTSVECPICEASAAKDEDLFSAHSAPLISCPRCGEYKLPSVTLATTGDALKDKPKSRASLQHLIKTKNLYSGKPIEFSHDSWWNHIEDPRLPNANEQIDAAIIWIGLSAPEPGQYLDYYSPKAYTYAGSISDTAFDWLLDQMQDSGLVIIERPQTVSTTHKSITLTLSGWNYFQEISRGQHSGIKAFMAMKFGEPDLDNLYKNHMTQAVSETGYKLGRVDDNPEAGSITNRMIVEIQTCRFLIADLTHDNAGAYWEAGYAEGLGKPVIYICEKDTFEDASKGTHFDVRQRQTVLWDKAEPELFCKALKATIRATLPTEAQMSDN